VHGTDSNTVRREGRGDPGGGASLHKEVVRKALAHAHRAALTAFVLAVSSAGLARDKDNRADAATLKARQHFFGPENVDPVSAAVRRKTSRSPVAGFSSTSPARATRASVLEAEAEQP